MGNSKIKNGFVNFGKGCKNYFSAVGKCFKIKNFIAYIIIAAVTIIFGALSLTGGLNSSTQILLEKIAYNIILAVSLSLVVGFLGELSLGHAGFMCLGAYIGGYMQKFVMTGLTTQAPFVSLILAMLIGGVVAAIFGFIIGLPALRLKGDYLAIVTLAFGEIVRCIFQNVELFGGAIGMQTYHYNRDSLFIICFIVAILTLVVINNFIKSKHGRAVMAIRDNEIAARAMGVNVTFYKLLVFIISAFFAGIAGVLFSNASSRINATASGIFDYNHSINILVMVVLGGMGSINGSIIAATVITYLNVKLQTILTGDLAALKNLIYALILIALVIYNNAPKLKAFRTKYNLRNFIEKIKAWVLKLFSKKVKNNAGKEVEFGADWSKVPTKIDMDAVLSTEIIPDNSFVPDKPDKPAKEKGDK